MESGNDLRQDLGLNCASCQGSMVSGTGICRGSGAQWSRGLGLDKFALVGVAINRFLSIIGTSHGDSIIATFLNNDKEGTAKSNPT